MRASGLNPKMQLTKLIASLYQRIVKDLDNHSGSTNQRSDLKSITVIHRPPLNLWESFQQMRFESLVKIYRDERGMSEESATLAAMRRFSGSRF